MTVRKLRANRRNARKAHLANVGHIKNGLQLAACQRNLKLAQQVAHKKQTWKIGLIAINKSPATRKARRRNAALARAARKPMTFAKPSKPQKFLRMLLRTVKISVKTEYSVTPYFLDLAVPNKKRAVEVDGPTHYDRKHPWYHRTHKIDKKRNRILRKLGWRIFHVRANYVEIQNKLERIVDFLKAA